MRLVNIETLQLEEFFEKDVPPYAILSHRWGPEELNFKDVLKNRVEKNGNGYKKLVGAAKVAADHKDVRYLWLDTCCIDKKSSAELSEAINSMYRWYKHSQICIAFLEDVTSRPNSNYSIRNSAWFTRCWTLQELLAPQVLHFYNSEWECIGNRNSLAPEIRDATGIYFRSIIANPGVKYPLAIRMSWAAKRFATRTEDIAYSLMGVFDINMPLLYGESEKAFLRLQEEILRRDTDLTFLLWGLNSKSRALFATSPADFQDVRIDSKTDWVPRRKRCSLTNMGLELKADLIKVDTLTYGLPLCEIAKNWVYAVLVQKDPDTDSMHRVGMKALSERYAWISERQITIQRHGPLSSAMTRYPDYGFEVQSPSAWSILPVSLQKGVKGRRTEIPCSEKYTLTGFECEFDDPTQPFVLRLVLNMNQGSVLWIDLSFDFESRPGALLYFDRLLHNPDRETSVWAISETITSDKFREIPGAFAEHCMVRTDGGLFFRCSNDKPVAASLPDEEWVSMSLPLFVAFVPSWRKNEKRLWSFRVAMTEKDLFDDTDLALWNEE